MQALLIAWSALAAPVQGPLAAPGLAVERVAALEGSFLALAVDADGGITVSLENGGLLRLVDADGDDYWEGSELLAAAPTGAQGLDWLGDTLLAVGRVEGDLGLWRLEPDPNGPRTPRLLLPIEGGGEHGPHAVEVGPDGMLWVVFGNESAPVTEPSVPLPPGSDEALLPVMDDPRGHANGVRYPAGVIARVDPRTGVWSHRSIGFRNPYDLAFDADGEPFTVDSDMEWDVGLPWYRPVRVLHCAPGADFGFRHGSAVWPRGGAAFEPDVVTLDRGSPTGVVIVPDDALGERYRGALLVGEWLTGKILAVHLAPAGGGWSATVSTLVEAGEGALPVTDLAYAPDGTLWFTTGGRGAVGGVYRVRTTGPEPKRYDDPVEAFLAGRLDWGHATADVIAPFALLDVASDERADVDRRLRALFWLDAAGEPAVLEPTGRDARLSAFVARHARTRPARGAWDAVHAPRVLRALAEAEHTDPVRVIAAIEEGDPWVRAAARRRARLEKWMTASDLGVRARPHPDYWAVTAGGSSPWWTSQDASWWSSLTMGYESAAVAERGVLLRAARRTLLASRTPESWPRVAPAISDFGVQVLAAFPGDDPLVAREAGEWLAMQPPTEREGAARDALFAALEAETDRVQAIHWAHCLVETVEPLEAAHTARLLRWFEETRDWTGGLSFAGYLARMRERLIERTDPRVCRALARGGALDAHTLALFVERLPEEEAATLLPALDTAWKRLPAGAPESPEYQRREHALRPLVHARVLGLTELLRSWMQGDGAAQETLWLALCDRGEAADFARFVQGLATPSRTVREAAARALTGLDQRPPDGVPWRGVLATAERLGWPRGKPHLGVLRHWRGDGDGAAAEDAGSWAAALADWRTWLAAEFPDEAAPVAASARPQWDAAALLAFLERSAARPGSSARGRDVFRAATCHTCHGIGTAAAEGGFGPELTGVTGRFDRASLVDAIVHPSANIADLYRTESVWTHSGERFDGRVLSDEEDALTLVTVDGSERRVAREEIETRRVSGVSTMPEGLLAPFTLEQVKDLFTYLAADGVTEPEPGPDWVDLLRPGAESRWQHHSQRWSFEPGLVVGTSEGLAASEYLISKDAFGDFELEADVCVSPGGNSGILFRSIELSSERDPLGYQLDLGQREWGALYVSERGTLARPDPALLAEVLRPGDWNHVHLTARGGLLRIELGGALTVAFDDTGPGGEPPFASAHLGLQLHAGPAMEVRVANLRVRPLY